MTKKQPEVQLDDFNAEDILTMVIPTPKWAVPEILPEGLTILAGKPKRGKSMLALNLAIGITNGGVVLGNYHAEKGPVLYLALEDTLRRLQTRLKKMLAAGGVASRDLIFYKEFPRMNRNGIELLEERIKIISGIRLVIIDTLGKFRPPKSAKDIQYDYDYEIGAALKSLADRCEVSILVVHHMRKTVSEDRFDDVIGSFGVTGSADGVMLLIRKTGQADAELHITGRDIEECQLAMEFDNEFLAWNVIGDVYETAKTGKQQQIIDILKNSQFSMSPKEIVKTTGLESGYVRMTLKRLCEHGLINKTDYGKYETSNI